MNNFKSQKGFTLIELLVVIAIIGILASVVLASLNIARTKGQEASIKSNLKNIIPQAELAYDVPGNYSTVCTDTKVVGMLTAITNAGGTAKCWTYDNTRWAVSAKLNSDTTKNWSVDNSGVVTWDTADKAGSIWDTANTNCAASGGHLPTPEQLRSLFFVYGGTPTSFGFQSGYYYWSGNLYTNSTDAYDVGMTSGNLFNNNKSSAFNVRCVH